MTGSVGELNINIALEIASAVTSMQVLANSVGSFSQALSTQLADVARVFERLGVQFNQLGDLTSKLGFAQAETASQVNKVREAFAQQLEQVQLLRVRYDQLSSALDRLGGSNRDIARTILSTRSTQDIRNDIALIQQSFQSLLKSGTDVQEIGRAFEVAQAKIAGFRQEMNGLPAVVNSSVAAVRAARQEVNQLITALNQPAGPGTRDLAGSVLGIRSDSDIQRDILKYQSALAAFQGSAAEVGRATLSAEADIARLNQELTGLAPAADLAKQALNSATVALERQLAQLQQNRVQLQLYQAELSKPGASLDLSRSVLGTVSTQDILAQIANVRQALSNLQNSGTDSQELARSLVAADAALAKLNTELNALPAGVASMRALRQETNQLISSLNQPIGPQTRDIARSILGTESDAAIERRIQLYQKAANVANIGASEGEVARNSAAAVAQIAKLELQLAGVAPAADVAKQALNGATAALERQALQLQQNRVQTQLYLAELSKPGASLDLSRSVLGTFSTEDLLANIAKVQQAVKNLQTSGTDSLDLARGLEAADAALAKFNAQLYSLSAGVVAIRAMRLETEKFIASLNQASGPQTRDLAHSILGTQTDQDIERQILKYQKAFAELANDASPAEFARNLAAMEAKIAPLAAQLTAGAEAEDLFTKQLNAATLALERQDIQLQANIQANRNRTQALLAQAGAGGIAPDVAAAGLNFRPKSDIEAQISLNNAYVASLEKAGLAEADVTRVRQLGSAANKTLTQELAGLVPVSNSAISSMGSLIRTIRQFVGISSFLGLILAVKGFADEIVAAGDAAIQFQAKLQLLVGSQSEASDLFQKLEEDSQRLRVPIQDNIAGFAKLAFSVQALGGSVNESRKLNDILQATAKLYGATAQEAASSALQFTQGLGLGVLRGQDLKSVISQNQELARQLAAGLGVSVAALKEMGNQGKLTADVIFQALLPRYQEIMDRFQSVPKTAADAFVILRNEIFETANSINDAVGFTAALVAQVLALADAIRELRNVNPAVAVAKVATNVLVPAVPVVVSTVTTLAQATVDFAKTDLGTLDTDFEKLGEKVSKVNDDLRQTNEEAARLAKLGQVEDLSKLSGPVPKELTFSSSTGAALAFNPDLAVVNTLTGELHDLVSEGLDPFKLAIDEANKHALVPPPVDDAEFLTSLAGLGVTMTHTFDEANKALDKFADPLKKLTDEISGITEKTETALNSARARQAAILANPASEDVALLPNIAKEIADLEAKLKYALEHGAEAYQQLSDSIEQKELTRAKKDLGDLSTRIAAHTREYELEKENAVSLAALQEDQLARHQKLIEFYAQAGLITEREAIQQRTADEIAGANARLASLQTQYQAKLNEIANTGAEKIARTAAGTIDQAGADKLANDLVKLDKERLELIKQMGLAEGKVTDATNAGVYAQGLYLVKLRDSLTAQARASQDYAISLKDQVEAQQLAIGLIGQSSVAQKQALIDRDAQVKIAHEELRVQRELDDLQSHAGGGDPATVNALKQGMLDFKNNTLLGAQAMKSLAAEEFIVQQRIKGINDAWQGVSNVFDGFITHLQDGWSSAMQFLRDSLKKLILQASTEFLAKQIVLPVFAQLTGGNQQALGEQAFPTLNALSAITGGGILGKLLGTTAPTGAQTLTPAFANLTLASNNSSDALTTFTPLVRGLSGVMTDAITAVKLFMEAVAGAAEKAANEQFRQAVDTATARETFAAPEITSELYKAGFDAAGTAATSFANTANTATGSIQDLIIEAANRYNVKPSALLAIAEQESHFDPNAIGPPTKYGQAQGLFQFLPSTAENLGINPRDPVQAADAAAKTISESLDRYSGDYSKAIADHFAGPDPRQHGPKTEKYTEEVTERMRKFDAALASSATQTEQFGAKAVEGAAKFADFKIEQPIQPEVADLRVLAQPINAFQDTLQSAAGNLTQVSGKIAGLEIKAPDFSPAEDSASRLAARLDQTKIDVNAQIDLAPIQQKFDSLASSIKPEQLDASFAAVEASNAKLVASAADFQTGLDSATEGTKQFVGETAGVAPQFRSLADSSGALKIATDASVTAENALVESSRTVDGSLKSFGVDVSGAAKAAKDVADGASSLSTHLDRADANITDFSTSLGGANNAGDTLAQHLSDADANLSDFSTGLGGYNAALKSSSEETASDLADLAAKAAAAADSVGGLATSANSASQNLGNVAASSGSVAGGFSAVLGSLGGFVGGLGAVIRGIGSIFGHAAGSVAGAAGSAFSAISGANTLVSGANTVSGAFGGPSIGSLYNTFATSSYGQTLGLSAPISTATSFGAAPLLAPAAPEIAAGGFSAAPIAAAFGPEAGTLGAAAVADAVVPAVTPFITATGAVTAGLTTLGAAIPVIGVALLAGYAIYSFLKDKKPSPTQGQFQITPTSTTTGFEDNKFTGSVFGNLGFNDANTKYFSGEAAQAFNAIIGGALDAFKTRFSPEQTRKLAGILQNTTFPQSTGGTQSTEDFIKQYGGDILKQVVKAAFDVLDPALGAIAEKFVGTADEFSKFANTLLGVHDAVKLFSTTFATNVGDAFTETLTSATALGPVLAGSITASVGAAAASVKPDPKPLTAAIDSALSSIKPDPKALTDSISVTVDKALTSISPDTHSLGASVGNAIDNALQAVKPDGKPLTVSIDTAIANAVSAVKVPKPAEVAAQIATPVAKLPLTSADKPVVDTAAAGKAAAQAFVEAFVANINAALADATQATADKVLAFVNAINEISVALPSLALQLAALKPADILAFVDALGGAANLAAKFAFLSANFTTTTDRMTSATAQLNAAFTAAGVTTIPQTHDQFLTLLHSFDLATESGRTAYAAVLNLSDAFVQIHGTADQAAATLRGFNDFFEQHFFTTAEQRIHSINTAWDSVHTAWNTNNIGARLMSMLGLDHIPTDVGQFRELITTLRGMGAAGIQLANDLLPLGPSIITLGEDAQTTAGRITNAEDVFNTGSFQNSAGETIGFHTPAEQYAAQIAKDNKLISDAFAQIKDNGLEGTLHSLGFDTIPTSVEGFRRLIDSINLTRDADGNLSPAMQLLYNILIQLSNPVLDLAHNADLLTASLNKANNALVVSVGTFASSGRDIGNAFLQSISGLVSAISDTSTQYATEIQLITGKIAQLNSAHPTNAADQAVQTGAISVLTQELDKVTNDLALFTVLSAQYGDDIAKQLVALLDWRTEQRRILGGGASPADIAAQIAVDQAQIDRQLARKAAGDNYDQATIDFYTGAINAMLGTASVLDAVDAVFNQNWNNIINGTAGATQSIDDFVKSIKSLASSAGGTQGQQLGIQLALSNAKLADLQKQYASMISTSPIAVALLASITKLQAFNATLATELANYDTYVAQYGTAIADQLVQLELWYADQQVALAGNAAALAIVAQIFHDSWDKIIHGAAAAVLSLDDFIKSIQSLGSGTKGNAGQRLGIELALSRPKVATLQAQYATLDPTTALAKAVLADITKLTAYNARLATEIDHFGTYSALYGDALASQLVDLETWYADQQVALAGNAEALAILKVIFQGMWDDLINGTTSSVSAFISAIQKIKDYLDSLKLGTLSTLTPYQKFLEAQKQFNAQLALAKTGDLTALQNITGFANTLLTTARDAFASSPQYTAILDAVTAALTGLTITVAPATVPPIATPGTTTAGTTTTTATGTTTGTATTPVTTTTAPPVTAPAFVATDWVAQFGRLHDDLVAILNAIAAPPPTQTSLQAQLAAIAASNAALQSHLTAQSGIAPPPPIDLVDVQAQLLAAASAPPAAPPPADLAAVIAAIVESGLAIVAAINNLAGKPSPIVSPPDPFETAVANSVSTTNISNVVQPTDILNQYQASEPVAPEVVDYLASIAANSAAVTAKLDAIAAAAAVEPPAVSLEAPQAPAPASPTLGTITPQLTVSGALSVEDLAAQTTRLEEKLASMEEALVEALTALANAASKDSNQEVIAIERSSRVIIDGIGGTIKR